MTKCCFWWKRTEKKLVYTGDFKDFDPDYCSLLGKINVLLCDGTNIGIRNGMTEPDVEREATRIMSETKGQVFVLCSATNAERIRRIERACRQSGRTIAVDPFAKAILETVSRMLFVNPVGFVPHYINAGKSPRSHKYFIANRDMDWNGSRIFSNVNTVSKMTNLTFLVQQTMEEFLKRLNALRPLADSTLIYSMWRGYESKLQSKRFLDLCKSIGMRIEYLHASGYVYRKMLKDTISKLKPDMMIPIDTEGAELFREMHEYVTLLEDGGNLEY